MILSDIPQHREAVGENASKIEFFRTEDKKKIVELMSLSRRNRKAIVYYTEEITAKSMAYKYMYQYKKMLK